MYLSCLLYGRACQMTVSRFAFSKHVCCLHHDYSARRMQANIFWRLLSSQTRSEAMRALATRLEPYQTLPGGSLYIPSSSLLDSFFMPSSSLLDSFFIPSLSLLYPSFIPSLSPFISLLYPFFIPPLSPRSSDFTTKVCLEYALSSIFPLSDLMGCAFALAE